MRILLTGSEGFVGKNLSKVLDKKKETVIPFDSGENLKKWKEDFYCLYRDIQQPDFIIHTGAVSNSQASTQELFEMNYETTYFLARAAYEWNARFIFLSSCQAIDPKIPYGWSKRCCEDLIRGNLHDNYFSILRIFNIWGGDESDKVSPSIAYKLATKQLAYVFNDCVRDFIHVRDLCELLVDLTINWQSGIFEVGSGIPTNIAALATHHGYMGGEFTSITNTDILIPHKSLVANRDRMPKGFEPQIHVMDRLMELYAKGT